MIRIKYTQLKVGDKFYLSEDSDVLCELVYGNGYISANHYYGNPDINMDVYIKAKDRFGKDLNIGDRVIILEVVGNWEHKLNEILINDIKSTEYVDCPIYGTVYLLTDKNNKQHQLKSTDIIKIESNWGI